MYNYAIAIENRETKNIGAVLGFVPQMLVLFVLEAMKMENEIMAPCDGTVTSVSVTKGAAVESGALLCTIG